MQKDLFRIVSARTIYLIVTCKVLFWSLAMIFFNAPFHTTHVWFELGDFWFTKYFMMALGLLALWNVYNSKLPVFYITSYAFLCLWSYLILGFVSVQGVTNPSFARLIVDFFFILFLIRGVHKKTFNWFITED
jgi:hypothetical protein